MMEKYYEKEVLVSASEGLIRRCARGIYHLEMEGITLHLAPAQFCAVARLFKLALGISAARSHANDHSPWQFHLKKQVINGGIR
ncbi:hypothetical protein MNBD_NITROSPIRAE01-1456 [hydrothermal vent metagenome]|uniref:Uncharacterized protein n=1 Tax=hydrothermal vent metagenome TaxID=652676 RepID=A0A3B1D836_9ZZZZ